MSYNEEKQLIFAKVRTTGKYGDDDNASGAATNAMVVSNVAHKPLEGNRISRDIVKGFLGSMGELQVTSFVELTFDVELTGSGSVDSPVAYSPLYHLAGVSETITAETSVDYALIDSGYKDGTIYYYVDNVLHKMLGARGVITNFTLGTGGIPKISFMFLGLYVKPENVGAVPAADFSAFKMPKAATSSTISVFDFYGHKLQMSELTVSPGGAVSHLDVANQEEIDVAGTRAGSISMKVREPDISTINFFDIKRSGVPGALNYQLGKDGDDAGFIFDMNIPALSVKNVTRSFEEGKSWLTIEADITPTAANTDLTWQHR